MVSKFTKKNLLHRSNDYIVFTTDLTKETNMTETYYIVRLIQHNHLVESLK